MSRYAPKVTHVRGSSTPADWKSRYADLEPDNEVLRLQVMIKRSALKFLEDELPNCAAWGAWGTGLGSSQVHV